MRMVVRLLPSVGFATGTVIKAGGDQSVHGSAHTTRLDGGNQYVHTGASAADTVINAGGWQVVQSGATADNTTVNADGKLQVNAGGAATNVTRMRVAHW